MLFVDDLTLSATGEAGSVTRLMWEVVEYVTHVLEQELLLEVSAKKSVVLASRPRLAAAAAAKMR